jgi:hypothetical protein
MKEKLERLISILEEMETMVVDKNMYDQLLFLEEDLDDFFEELDNKMYFKICKN